MDYVIEVGRRERKRQAVHQQLLDVARLLFQERGVARTTVDDIAAQADVARQTVFNHFPYKEAFCLELGADGVQDIALRAHALLEIGTSALEVLRHAARWVLDQAIEEGEIAVAVARELLHSDPDRAAQAARCIPLREIFEAILLQAREEGTLRNDLPLNAVAALFSALFRSILLQAASAPPEQLRRELEICFDIWFNGIIDRSR
jgi:AcrR family transcriptional regulator